MAGFVGLTDEAGIAISATNPLDVTATFSPSGTQDVALTKINATATAVGNGVVGNGVQRVSIASDNTAFPVKLDQTTPGTTNAVALSTLGANAVAVGNGASSTGTLRVTVASDSTGYLGVTNVSNGEYETVAASQTAQVLGATGATGDFLSGLLVIPATTSPGNVIVLDNATSITVFAGGASSVSNLVPFFIPMGVNSVSGAWKVTTGASVSVIGVGNFT